MPMPATTAGPISKRRWLETVWLSWKSSCSHSTPSDAVTSHFSVLFTRYEATRLSLQKDGMSSNDTNPLTRALSQNGPVGSGRHVSSAPTSGKGLVNDRLAREPPPVSL